MPFSLSVDDRLTNSAAFAKLEADARAFANAVVRVGPSAPYGYGIETGYKRGGGLARRAGGVFYLTRAAQDVMPTIPGVVAAQMAQGKTPLQGLIAAGFDLEARAKAYEDVVSVTRELYRSIQTVYPGRPAVPFAAARVRVGGSRGRAGAATPSRLRRVGR